MMGGWVISNHQATASPNWTVLVCNTGSGDGSVQTTLVNGNSAPFSWLVFRYVNGSNYWIWGKINGDYQLGYFSNSGFNLKTNTGISSRDGDVLEVVMNGSTVTGLLNGVVRAQVTDGAFQTATWHGLGMAGQAPAGLFGPIVQSTTPPQVGPPVTTGIAFSDNFNRPNGPIGGPWVQDMNGGWNVSANQATTTTSWTAMLVGVGSGDGTVKATLVNGA